MKLLRKTYSSLQPIAKKDIENAYIDIGQVVNGGIHFGGPTSTPSTEQTYQNVNGFWFSGRTPSVANKEFVISHNLGRIPNGWGPMSIDQAGILYRSTTPWTQTQVYMKCNVANANIVIFLT